MTKKKTKLPRIDWKMLVLVTGLFLIGIVIFNLNKKVSYKSKAASVCTIGQTNNQGCAAYNCEVGTRRVCTCVEPGKWECLCNADRKCVPKPDSGNGGGQNGGGGAQGGGAQGGGQGGGAQGNSGLSGLRNCIQNVCKSGCNPNSRTNTVSGTQGCFNCVRECMGL